MEGKSASRIMLTLLLAAMATSVVTSFVKTGLAWSNGGYSTDSSHPKYGTHDWIAQHALDWLPTGEKQFILDNLAAYLYGTELPDNGAAADGIGDTANHHVYYNSAKAMTDDASAKRASTEYSNTLNFLKAKDYANAAKNAGLMSHYIADVAVFAHVMGSGTDWGAEVHHSDYETYVNDRTSNYNDEFNSYLSFDGSLTTITAYDAAKNLAYDTTFDPKGGLTCVWMDQNYNWNDPTFKNRAGESLNLAINYLTDVLHTLYSEATTTKSDTTPPTTTDNYDNMWHTIDFTIILTANDAGRGVDETSYQINGGSIQNVSTNGQPLITTEGANNKLEYWSTDKAGNEELPHKIRTGIKLDKTVPIAKTDPNRTVNMRITLAFDAQNSSDNIGIATYEWNFGDETTGTGKTTTHTYANLGTYEATLTVKDAAGNTDTQSITITVLPAVLPTEAFPTWIVGAAVAIIAVGVVVAVALRRK